jgi:hypothetical protein
MTGQGDKIGGSGTTTNSSDSAPLSDPFVAIPTGKAAAGSRQRVRAPEGSQAMEVRRSSRVAANRTRSVQPSTFDSSAQAGMAAPPGGNHPAFLAPQALQVVPEEDQAFPAQSLLPSVSRGKTVDFRDSVTPQMTPSVGRIAMTGRKRSASSAIPESMRRGHNPNKLASAADFPPGHFDEPNSDFHIPPMDNFPNDVQTSPMRIDRAINDATPISSPLSHNPLLFNPTHTSSPPVITRDGNVAWAAMEGLLPIGEGFQAPGYAPVGGVSYRFQSPRLGKQSSRGSAKGRQLFAEYASMAEPGPLDQVRQAGPQIASHSGQQTASQFGPQIASLAEHQGVRFPYIFLSSRI